MVHNEYFPLTDPVFQAICREASSVAEHIGIGATAIGKANYAQEAYYMQAFFALWTGFERGVKLALTINHAELNGGQFLSGDDLRKLGHDITGLMKRAKALSIELRSSECPETPVHNGILHVLHSFATNRNRYRNFELIGNPQGATELSDPISDWYHLVIEPILALKYTAKKRIAHEENARITDTILGPSSFVMHTSEEGRALTNLYETSIQSARVAFASQYARVAVLQIARFLASILRELTYKAYELKLEQIPDLNDFFAIYTNDDKYFKSRRVWSLYKI